MPVSTELDVHREETFRFLKNGHTIRVCLRFQYASAPGLGDSH